jgi:hypothetical protein
MSKVIVYRVGGDPATTCSPAYDARNVHVLPDGKGFFREETEDEFLERIAASDLPVGAQWVSVARADISEDETRDEKGVSPRQAYLDGLLS